MSHEEALYHYGLTDREPMQYSITIYTGYGYVSIWRCCYEKRFISAYWDYNEGVMHMKQYIHSIGSIEQGYLEVLIENWSC